MSKDKVLLLIVCASLLAALILFFISRREKVIEVFVPKTDIRFVCFEDKSGKQKNILNKLIADFEMEIPQIVVHLEEKNSAALLDELNAVENEEALPDIIIFDSIIKDKIPH
jgi:ABC-type glycerol-3-phosphate transport system substrate-binding protein